MVKQDGSSITGSKTLASSNQHPPGRRPITQGKPGSVSGSGHVPNSPPK